MLPAGRGQVPGLSSAAAKHACSAWRIHSLHRRHTRLCSAVLHAPALRRCSCHHTAGPCAGPATPATPPRLPGPPAEKPMRPSCRRCAVGDASWLESASCLSPNEAAAPAPSPQPSSFVRAWAWKPCGSAAPEVQERGSRWAQALRLQSRPSAVHVKMLRACSRVETHCLQAASGTCC